MSCLKSKLTPTSYSVVISGTRTTSFTSTTKSAGRISGFRPLVKCSQSIHMSNTGQASTPDQDTTTSEQAGMGARQNGRPTAPRNQPGTSIQSSPSHLPIVRSRQRTDIDAPALSRRAGVEPSSRNLLRHMKDIDSAAPRTEMGSRQADRPGIRNEQLASTVAHRRIDRRWRSERGEPRRCAVQARMLLLADAW
ncbi:hypothetical protein OBBRIDRAFT_886801 [Obba rivulosa]|uniref:Uncharacterized protein n=1 Tax=Obba rivulosa TaxID=1052685 RepID=A0A8E2DNV8_9APHY|nr:hypothetical protein OBBRIDRAFT_886801 [Obba rivulosa]